MSPEGETEVVLEKSKRAPRKRAAKAVSIDVHEKESVKSTPRKRATTKASTRSGSEESMSRAATRKAPTPLATIKDKNKKSRKNLIVVVVLLLLGIGSSAAVGFTDKGQIDIADTIAKRNEAARAAGQPEFTIPVQDTQLPNGGLIGVGDEEPMAPPTPVATSTDVTASSTEAASTETASTSSQSSQ